MEKIVGNANRDLICKGSWIPFHSISGGGELKGIMWGYIKAESVEEMIDMLKDHKAHVSDALKALQLAHKNSVG